MKSKLGAELSFNTIVTLIIVLIVLILAVFLLYGQGGKLLTGLKTQVENVLPLANTK
ncbi:hypothetical protein HZB00_01070 [Candidatus Woesearchaeota archaeon]|nr:hypothetical protein [Candidatus Woesearchaeota archaeon]